MLDNEGIRYDLIASEFAKLRSEFNTEKKYIDIFTSYLTKSASILDLGCGSGNPIAKYLIQQGFIVTGIDASKKLLEIAKLNIPQLNCLYGDVRTIELKHKYDGIIEWWCLFHLPKSDQIKMFSRFASWLNPNGIIQFTTGDTEYQGVHNDMLNQELNFYSLDANVYESLIKKHGFKLLLKEYDQDQHLVWIAKYIIS